MRVYNGRLGIALLACAILVLLSVGGAGRGRSVADDGPPGAEFVKAAATTPTEGQADVPAAAASAAHSSTADRSTSHRPAVDPSTADRAPAGRTPYSAEETTEDDRPAAGVAPAATAQVVAGGGEVGAAPAGRREEAARAAEPSPRPAGVGESTASGFAAPDEGEPPVRVADGSATPPPPSPPGELRGFYVTGWTAGSPRMSALVDTMVENGLNAVVIELKGEDGIVSYPTRSPLARSIGADSRKIRDLPALVERLHEKGLFVIGRIVAFQDELLAEARPEWALTRKADGSVWRDAGGQAWVNPDSIAVRTYLHTLAVEAARSGVDEIQWDYVRFPSEGDLSAVAFTNELPKVEVITSFLRSSRDKLHNVGAAISADLFGYAAVATTDVGIGQRLEPVSDAVDYVSLMVYPSHFSSGSMGIALPDRAPGVTVYESMRRAVERTTAGKHRPWLQAFSLLSKYTDREVAAQIAALRALGIRSWILWNASNRYDGMLPSAALLADSVDAMGKRIAEGVLTNDGMGLLSPVAEVPVEQPDEAAGGPAVSVAAAGVTSDEATAAVAVALKLETPAIRAPLRVEPSFGLLEPRLVR